MKTTIGFPGLGIDDFYVNPVAFSIFGRNIAWYGIIISCGMILAYFYAMKNFKKEGIKSDDFVDILLFAIPFGIISARAFYVIFSLDEYDSFYEMIEIWKGGISILGAVLGGILTVICVCKVKKISVLKSLDALAPAVLIGQIIGRWGNFMNAEVYGSQTTILWRMRISNAIVGTVEVHPLFLYEALWNVIGFTILHFMYRKKKYDGQIFWSYVFWYSLIRSLLELMRNDAFILKTQTGLPASFIISIVGCVSGLVLLIYNAVKNKKTKEI
ncbi:MAG: prolipoprotein diacylglyceryl transferase [Clostridia bacterium]|nr:prolipoprotein diacylglyceryl transferase [Clostridia bacterium]